MSKDFLGIVANIVAAFGVGICAVAGLTRLLATHHLMGFEAITLFTGGIALMVFSALIKLHIIETLISRQG